MTPEQCESFEATTRHIRRLEEGNKRLRAALADAAKALDSAADAMHSGGLADIRISGDFAQIAAAVARAALERK